MTMHQLKVSYDLNLKTKLENILVDPTHNLLYCFVPKVVIINSLGILIGKMITGSLYSMEEINDFSE